MGKAKTETAGEYPEKLATEVAKLIVMTWKRVLGLEWWRHKVATSEEEVSQYSKKWLEAEKNRVSPPGKKRSWTVAFEEPREESKEGLEREEREERPKRKVTSRAFEGANNPNDSMPDASGQPSKKARREGQDDFSVGGMRHPKKAVDRLHLLKSCGMHVRNRWELFYMRNPSARQVAKDYGTKDAEIDPEVLEAWKKQLEEEFATGPEEAGEGGEVGLRVQVTVESPPLGRVAKEVKGPGRTPRELHKARSAIGHEPACTLVRWCEPCLYPRQVVCSRGQIPQREAGLRKMWSWRSQRHKELLIRHHPAGGGDRRDRQIFEERFRKKDVVG